MSSLEVRISDDADTRTVRINNGTVSVDGDGDLSDLVGPFDGMEIMVGKEPPGENDTPAEKFEPATDKEIQQTLIGVLRNEGYGVKTN